MKTKHDNNGGIVLIEDLVVFMDERVEVYQSLVNYLNNRVDDLRESRAAAYKRVDVAQTNLERAERLSALYKKWLQLAQEQNKVDLADADEKLDRYVLGAVFIGFVVGGALVSLVSAFIVPLF